MSCRRTMRSSSSFMRGRGLMPSLRCLRQARRTARKRSPEDPLLESADVERIGVDTGSVCYVLAFPRA